MLIDVDKNANRTLLGRRELFITILCCLIGPQQFVSDPIYRCAVRAMEFQRGANKADNWYSIWVDIGSQGKFRIPG